MRTFRDFFLLLVFCFCIIENLPRIAMVTGLVYVTLFVFCYNLDIKQIRCPEFRPIGILWWVLFVYLTTITLLNPSFFYNISIDIKWLRAIILFCFVFYNTIDRPRFQSSILYLYSFSVIIGCLLALAGIGIGVDEEDLGQSRLTFFGMNTNKFAIILVYCIVCLLSFIEDKTYIKNDLLRYIIVGVSTVMVISIIAMTGSRGALIIIFVLFTYYFLIYSQKKNKIRSFLIVIIGLIVIVYLFNYMMSFDVLSNRIIATEEGNYGERDILLKAGFDIFMQSPIFGVGMEKLLELIQGMVGQAKTTHNLYIYILATGGIIGFSIFSIILIKIVKIVYNIGFKNHLFLPVAFCIVALLDFAKNGGALSFNSNYLFLSLALSMSLSKQMKIVS